MYLNTILNQVVPSISAEVTFVSSGNLEYSVLWSFVPAEACEIRNICLYCLFQVHKFSTQNHGKNVYKFKMIIEQK